MLKFRLASAEGIFRNGQFRFPKNSGVHFRLLEGTMNRVFSRLQEPGVIPEYVPGDDGYALIVLDRYFGLKPPKVEVIRPAQPKGRVF